MHSTEWSQWKISAVKSSQCVSTDFKSQFVSIVIATRIVGNGNGHKIDFEPFHGLAVAYVVDR